MRHIPFFSLRRVKSVFFLRLQALDIIPGSYRSILLRWAGVKVGNACHIGGGNLFDSIHPDMVSIGNHVTISVRCVILTHFVKQHIGKRDYHFGEVKIGDNVFIGANVVICQPVTIGENAAIAAGAVVTKDIPAGEIWGGVPARFIKKVE